MQTKSTKRHRNNSSFKFLSRIFPKIPLPPKKWKNEILYNIFPNSKFSKVSKNRIHFCSTLPCRIACQISGWYTYFWQTYSPKPYFWWRYFQTAIWSISRHRTEIKWHFWNSEIELAQKHMLFVRKYQFDNLNLCDPGLTLPFSIVDFLGVRLQNGFDFWILRAKMPKKRVPHARTRVFEFGDLSWP